MKKIGNVLVLIGFLTILLPIIILIVSGVFGFIFGCTGAVTGGGVECANSSVLPMIEFTQGLGYVIGIYGIWLVGIPALLIGFVLKSIGRKTLEAEQDTFLDNAVKSSGLLLTRIILLGFAVIFWWIVLPLYIFFAFKHKSMKLGYERFKKFIF